METHHPLHYEELLKYKTFSCPNRRPEHLTHCLGEHHQHYVRRPPVVINEKTGEYERAYKPARCSLEKNRKNSRYHTCPRGSRCDFAHSKEESMYHPEMYLLRACTISNHKYGKNRLGCSFYHSESERRVGDLNREKYFAKVRNTKPPKSSNYGNSGSTHSHSGSTHSSSNSSTTASSGRGETSNPSGAVAAPSNDEDEKQVEDFLAGLSAPSSTFQPVSAPNTAISNIATPGVVASNSNTSGGSTKSFAPISFELNSSKSSGGSSRPSSGTVCQSFRKGKCTNGSQCPNIHLVTKIDYRSIKWLLPIQVTNMLLEIVEALQIPSIAREASSEALAFFQRPSAEIEIAFKDSNSLSLTYELLMQLYKSFKLGYISPHRALQPIRGCYRCSFYNRFSDHERAMIKCACLVLLRADQSNSTDVLPPDAKGNHIQDLSRLVEERYHEREELHLDSIDQDLLGHKIRPPPAPSHQGGDSHPPYGRPEPPFEPYNRPRAASVAPIHPSRMGLTKHTAPDPWDASKLQDLAPLQRSSGRGGPQSDHSFAAPLQRDAGGSLRNASPDRMYRRPSGVAPPSAHFSRAHSELPSSPVRERDFEIRLSSGTKRNRSPSLERIASNKFSRSDLNDAPGTTMNRGGDQFSRFLKSSDSSLFSSSRDSESEHLVLKTIISGICDMGATHMGLIDKLSNCLQQTRVAYESQSKCISAIIETINSEDFNK